MGIVYIYGLECPVLKRIMYVGKSIRPKDRYLLHASGGDGGIWCKKSRWINWLIAQNLKPHLVFIEACNDDDWRERERYWIKYFFQYNPHLTNTNYDGAMQGDRCNERRNAYKIWCMSNKTIDEFRYEMFAHVDLPKILPSVDTPPVTIADLFNATDSNPSGDETGRFKD